MRIVSKGHPHERDKAFGFWGGKEREEAKDAKRGGESQRSGKETHFSLNGNADVGGSQQGGEKSTIVKSRRLCL